MIKFLKALKVIQEVSNKDRNPKLGGGYSTAKRLNPYNPLSYVLAILVLIVGIVMFGVIGFWDEISPENPLEWFKWN